MSVVISKVPIREELVHIWVATRAAIPTTDAMQLCLARSLANVLIVERSILGLLLAYAMSMQILGIQYCPVLTTHCHYLKHKPKEADTI